MIKDLIQHKHAILHFLFEERAKTHPNRIAVMFEGQSFTYEVLNRKANQLAHYLLAGDLLPETLIAISLPRSMDMFIGVLAILKAGCAYLPMDETYPVEKQAFIFSDAKTPILLTHSALKANFSHFQGEKLYLDEIWQKIRSYPDHNPFTISKPNNLVYVIYTSGSTGQSKGVLIEHGSLVNYIQWISNFMDFNPQDRLDFSANFAFDMAVTVSVAALAMGLTVVICPDHIKKNIRDYLQYLQKHAIGMIKVSPSYFKLMVEETRQTPLPLPALRMIMLGGENLPAHDCQAWLQTYPKHHLFNEYGPTETTVGVTMFKVTSRNISHYQGFVPIGKPGSHINCMVMDDKGQPAEAGKMGELYVSGNCLARGYLNQPDLTAQQFVSQQGVRWYRTGDICETLPDGNLLFCGRMDDQVKIRGFKVVPREIELSLLNHENIKDVVVVAQQTRAKDNRLIAYYQVKDQTVTFTPWALRDYLRAHLPDFMIPSNFILLDHFPLTENGKLDKAALPEPLIMEEKTTRSRSKTEKTLQYIWRKVFHLEKIGLSTDFFELGGNSLMAARVISNIQKYMNKKLTVEDIYKAPDIKSLALLVDAVKPLKKEKIRKSFSFEKSRTIPLSDFQFVLWISRLFAPQIRDLNIVASRRLAGNLDVNQLKVAFKELLKRHEVLRYRAGKFYPGQYLDAHCHFELEEEDLSHHSTTDQTKVLSDSLDHLLYKHAWQKGQPLLKAKLSKLHNENHVLQIAASHMVFDDASHDILFSELSKLYLGINDLPLVVPYSDYISYERNHLNRRINDDIRFWQRYLHDTALLKLPANVIVTDMQQHAWSTCLALPDEALSNLLTGCRQQHVNVTDILFAAIALSLKETAGNLHNKKILFNLVKSTRDNEAFDHGIGCYLKMDALKVDMDGHNDLIELSKHIQQSRLETALHQDCSGMLKVACLEKQSRRKRILNRIFHVLGSCYAGLFKKYDVNPQLLMMYQRLKGLTDKEEFLVTINVFNNFIAAPSEKKLFGLDVLEEPVHYYDYSNVNNLLSICFFKNPVTDKAYVAISGNLQSSFRQNLGERIIQLCHTGFESCV